MRHPLQSALYLSNLRTKSSLHHSRLRTMLSLCVQTLKKVSVIRLLPSKTPSQSMYMSLYEHKFWYWSILWAQVLVRGQILVWGQVPAWNLNTGKIQINKKAKPFTATEATAVSVSVSVTRNLSQTPVPDTASGLVPVIEPDFDQVPVVQTRHLCKHRFQWYKQGSCALAQHGTYRNESTHGAHFEGWSHDSWLWVDYAVVIRQSVFFDSSFLFRRSEKFVSVL